MDAVRRVSGELDAGIHLIGSDRDGASRIPFYLVVAPDSTLPL